MSRSKKTPQLPVRGIRTKYNLSQFKPETGEINNKPSQTIPGEDVPLSRFIRMHTQGEIPPLAMSAFDGYMEDVDIDANIDDRTARSLAELEEAMRTQDALIQEQQELLAYQQEQLKEEASTEQAPDDNDSNEQEEAKEVV